MNMPRIIWIPWPEAEAEEFLERSTQWNDVSGKGFQIITWSPGTSLDLLETLMDGKIYMRGHGTPGSPFVTTKGKSLNIRESIDRIIGMGLQPAFAGTIKFYSCYSAVDGVVKMRTQMVNVPKVKL